MRHSSSSKKNQKKNTWWLPEVCLSSGFLFWSLVLHNTALGRQHPKCLSRVCNYTLRSFERRKPAAGQNKRSSPPNCGGFNRSCFHAERLVLAADWAKGGGDSLAKTHRRTHAHTPFFSSPSDSASFPSSHTSAHSFALRGPPPPPHLSLLIGRRSEVARSPHFYPSPARASRRIYVTHQRVPTV